MPDTTYSDDRQILDCLSDYCNYIDRYDVDSLVGLFTSDGAYDFGFGRIFRGQEALRTLFKRVEAHRVTSHHISNTRITQSGDRASVRSALYAYHLRAADETEVHVWGQYLDDFVRIDGRWLIAHRALRVAHEKGTRPEGGHATLYEYLPRAVPAH
jgi:ketosteroid isomerase-like protein